MSQELWPHHHDLIHYFLLEYLVKGEQGLPVLVPDAYDRSAALREEYVEHVLGLYKNKPKSYESEQSFQPRQHTCRSLLVTTTTEAPPEKTGKVNDSLVKLPLNGWDPQQFKVVAELIQDDQQAMAAGMVNLTPVQVRTESQELAMLYLQPTKFEHTAPPAHQPLCHGASTTSDLPARNHGTATATAVHTSAAMTSPRTPGISHSSQPMRIF